MYCRKCGAPIKEDNIFCEECGTPIIKKEEKSIDKEKSKQFNVFGAANRKKIITIISGAFVLIVAIVCVGLLTGEDSTIAEKSMKLWGGSNTYKITINGTDVAFPCKLEDFEKSGLTVENADGEVPPNVYEGHSMCWDPDVITVIGLVRFYSAEGCCCRDASISSLDFWYEEGYETDAVDVELPNGITNYSTPEEALALCKNQKYEYDESETNTLGIWREIKFGTEPDKIGNNNVTIHFWDDKIYEISICFDVN